MTGMVTELSSTWRSDSDYLWGAKAIAEYLGLTERQVRYAEERGELPIGRSGGKLFTKKQILDDHLMGLATELNQWASGGNA